MRLFLFRSVPIFSICAVIACQTPTRTSTVSNVQTSANKGSTKPLISKEGQKVPTNSPAVDTSLEAATKPTLSLTSQYERLLDTSLPLRDEDSAKADMFDTAEPGSLLQATAILAFFRQLRQTLDSQAGYSSEDLYSSASSTSKTQNGGSPSLEVSLRNKNIDLRKVLESNNYLKNSRATDIITDLLERTQNSPAFSTGIVALIKGSNLAGTSVAATPTQTVLNPVKDTSAKNNQEEKKDTTSTPMPDRLEAPEVKAAINELKKSDSLLMLAQRFADKGEFKTAIEQASSVEASDPFYLQAKEKIKLYSNRAVQDLRKKAAEAFQNSMPLSEPKAKIAYLTQAREHLEAALKNFPAADQLDIVKDNLAIINRDLVNLEGSVELKNSNSPLNR